MAYVYKYVDKKDHIVKYVGIVYEESRSLRQRIIEHQRYDSWCSDSEWDIYYLTADIDNRTDAEYFEAHYISLYHTDKYYNKSKSGWGVSKYLPNREGEWVLYNNTDEMVVGTTAERFLADYLQSDKKHREDLYQRFIERGPGERANSRLEYAVNSLLNRRFGLDYDQRYAKGSGALSLYKDHIAFIFPMLNGETRFYKINPNGNITHNKFTIKASEFVQYAKEYIHRLSAAIDALDCVLNTLFEDTAYFNK